MISKFLIPVVIFLMTFLLLAINIQKPFYGVHDWNGVRYGNIARNYLRYGFIQTKLGQVENSGMVEFKDFVFLTHYPPLLPILVSLSFSIFGISELSTRLIPTLATAFSLVLIYLIAQKLWGRRIAFLSTVLVMFTPLVLYFGKNPVHEPLVVFFSLLAFYEFTDLVSGKLEVRRRNLFYLGIILSELTTWVGYFLLPALTTVFLIKRNKKVLSLLLPLWVISIGLFTTHLLHNYFLTGDIFGGTFKETFFQRTAISEVGRIDNFNFISYILRIRLWFFTLFSGTLVILALLGFISPLFKGKQIAWPLLVWGIYGVIYVVAFSNAFFIHNYLVFYFLPFLAFAGGIGLDKLLSFIKAQKVQVIVSSLIVFLVFYERHSFLISLLGSQTDKFSVEVGQAIHNKTLSTDTVQISPASVAYASEYFLKFYSDRKLIFSNDLNNLSDYQVLIDSQNQKFKILKNK